MGSRGTKGEGAPDLEALTARVEAARAAWPTLSIDTEGAVRYVAERLAREDAGGAGLAGLHVEDLLLAYACACGDPRAVATFEATFFKDLGPILARVTTDVTAVEELAQTLRVKLLVAQGAAPPKISEYSGRGALRGWFRVTATRHAISALRRPVREVGAEDDDLASIGAASLDPELRYLRKLYGKEFRRAFEDAADALTSEDRNLLRYHYVDRLDLDEIGAIVRVHRVTVARRLARVRGALVDEVRRLLRARLNVGATELESILGLVKSELELSFRRVLEKKD